MNECLHVLRQNWSRSRVFRVILVIAVIYAGLRLTVQVIYLGTLLAPENLPEWFGAEEPMIPNDLQDYLDGANRLQNRQDLYVKGKLDRVEFYQYSPVYALVFAPFLWLPPSLVAIIHTLLHIIAYWMLYIWWGRIFRRLGLDQANETLAWTLPVWLVFSAFWSDLGYLNIYIIMALLGTLLIDAVLNERLGWSLLWLSIIVQIKPQWAFAAVVPLFLGRWRFFLKLLIFAVIVYVAIVGITMLAVGPSYGWQQYVDYVQFLFNMPKNFPWRGPDAPFLGYNHSIMQIVIYILGFGPNTMRLAIGIKALLLAPLAILGLRLFIRPLRQPGHRVPQSGLDLAFALYLGAFIWLDVVWEVSLGIAVFTYLLATLEQRNAKILVWSIFLPYALVDFWQLVSYVVFGADVVAPGMYVLTDPSIYLPLVMIVILTFYALLIRRLWSTTPMHSSI